MNHFSASRLVGPLLVSLLLALSIACFPSAAQRIAFVSLVDGDPEIFLLDPQTGEALPLTSNGSADIEPRLSPDGKHMAFLSDESGDLEINLLDIKEGGIVRLTHSAGDDLSPRWSPDGRRLAFISQRDGQSEVYLMNADGSNPTRITTNATEDRLGDWSPDDIWLVFSSVGTESEMGLWLRNPDGVNLIHLTKGQDSDPAWSPDGRHVAFVRTDGGNADIYVASRLTGSTWQDATELIRLTQDQAEDLAPAWALDSKTLAFVSYRDGTAEIYTMSQDGSNQRRLTSNVADDLAPVWSPDGSRIAFVSHLYGPGEIFVMDSDGRRQLRLTNNNAEDHSPDW